MCFEPVTPPPYLQDVMKYAHFFFEVFPKYKYNYQIINILDTEQVVTTATGDYYLGEKVTVLILIPNYKLIITLLHTLLDTHRSE